MIICKEEMQLLQNIAHTRPHSKAAAKKLFCSSAKITTRIQPKAAAPKHGRLYTKHPLL